jgi:hypothetical protein
MFVYIYIIMDFLITETQLRKILTEQDKSKMSDYMKTLYSFTSDLVSNVYKKYELNLKMLLTWGTSVGGMVMPLDNFIKTGNFDLTEDQQNLILVGIAMFIFYEGKTATNKVLKKIKEEGLQDTFKVVLEKAKKLKTVFAEFLKSANVITGGFLETVAYSFLIPIITDIYSMAIDSVNMKQTSILIAQRLVSTGVVLLTVEVLSVAIRKIIRKFKKSEL